MGVKFKRMGAFLIALAIICTLLPAGLFPVEAKATIEESHALTAADYAQADAVFAMIDQVASAPAQKDATQQQKTENAVNAVINEPAAVKGGPQGSQVYLVGPYYGIDSNFTNQYKEEATRVASAIGDTDGYTLYSGAAANIDNVAAAVSNGAVVFFDSHGATDYQNPYNSNDYITGATCSYLCLTTSDGLTTQDYDDGAAYSDGVAFVNGALSVQQLQMSAMLVCGAYKIELASAPYSVT